MLRHTMARGYGIGDCPVARTLDLIGQRWTALLLRDLLLHGPRRFQDFQDSLPGVAPNTLSARLKAMEDDGLVERVLYSERPPRLEYVLTDRGRSLGPVIRAMREWGLAHPPGRRSR
jgi:DNA-binding HxlR family transcriptional regulator